MSTLLDQLRAQMSKYDEEAFVALANRGLLRRAQKDLEKGAPRIEAAPEKILVHTDKYVVELDERGPAHARCTCPSAGVCQHILCAALALAQGGKEAGAAEPSPSARGELHEALLKIAPDELERWAGRAALRWAIEFVSDLDMEAVTLGGDDHLLIAFARPRITFRYMGGGIDTIITDYKGREREKQIAAAVLAYRRAYGLSLPEPPSTNRRATTALDLGKEHELPQGATAHLVALRETVLNSTAALIRECIEIGLSHLSQTIQQRLTTLSVSAQGADLHRLALMLRRLADHVEMLLQREGGADEEQLLNDLALAYGLVHALRSAMARKQNLPLPLLGEARTSYEDAGKLELLGLGAYPWRTASGYVGLTLLFWSPEARRWYSYSESRPEIQGGLDPAARYLAPGPWPGSGLISNLARSRITLLHARTNRFGRLSSSDKTTAVVHEGAPGCVPPGIDDWSAISIARGSTSLLAERNPHDELAILRPTRFEPPTFDPARQQLLWPLYDRNGVRLVARLDFAPHTEHAIGRIEALEQHATDSAEGIVVRLMRQNGEIVAQPIALLSGQSDRPVDVLSFDPEHGRGNTSGLISLLKGVIGTHPSKSASPDMLPPALQRFLDNLSRETLRAAERGIGDGDTLPPTLVSEIRRCARAGLDVFADLERSNAPDRLLRLHYLIMQTRRTGAD